MDIFRKFLLTRRVAPANQIAAQTIPWLAHWYPWLRRKVDGNPVPLGFWVSMGNTLLSGGLNFEISAVNVRLKSIDPGRGGVRQFGPEVQFIRN
jgi:hypothetical protein